MTPPPLNPDYVDPEMLNLIRRVDLILAVVDVQTHPEQHLTETVDILEANRIAPLHRRDRYPPERRMTFKPLLVLANKCDDEETDEIFEIFCALLEDKWPLLPISAATGRHVERLGRAVLDRLGIIRIYSKAPGKEPDYRSPFVMRRGARWKSLPARSIWIFTKR